MRIVAKRCISLAGRILRHTPLARSQVLNRLQGNIAVRLHRSNMVGLGTFKVQFDPLDRNITRRLILYGEYDKGQIELLCSFVKPGDDVLDIGAHIGIYSLYLSRAVGSQGHVLSVEPDPRNIALLRTNLRLNACENVIVAPYAFGDRTGNAKLFQLENDTGRSSLWDKGGARILVGMRRGDDVVREYNLRPTVAKIDVEGAEPLVLTGLMDKRPRVLLFELATDAILKLGHDPHGFLSMLVSEGYRLGAVHASTGRVKQGTIEEVMSFLQPLPDGGRYGNILAVRTDYTPAAKS
jgi:FkbM family methyltransferase